MTKTEKRRIKKEIESIMNEFNYYKKEFRFINDGNGDRYRIGELYLSIEDYKGLNKYYTWFYHNFPDDIGFPEIQICWIIGGIKSGDKNIVIKHLIQLEDINIYVIPKLLDQKYERKDIWEGMNLSTEEYADYVKEEFQKHLDTQVSEYLKQITETQKYREFKSQLIENYCKLNKYDRGIRRSKIISDNDNLLKKWELSFK